MNATLPPSKLAMLRRARIVGAVGLGAVLLGGLWVLRAPMAETVVRGALNGRGVESEFTVARFDFGGLVLEGLRLGPTEAPDLTAERLGVGFGWRPLPRIGSVALEGAVLRARVGPEGASLGQLDALLDREAPPGPPRLPTFDLSITDAVLLAATPVGEIRAEAEGAGRLGRDFKGLLILPVQSVARPEGGSADGLTGRLSAASGPDGLTASLAAQAQRLAWPQAGLSGGGLILEATAGLDGALQALRISARGRGDLTIAGAALSGLDVKADAASEAWRKPFDPADWRLSLAGSAAGLTAGEARSGAASATLSLGDAQGPFRIETRALEGFGLSAGAAALDGRLSVSAVEAGGLSVRAEGALRASEARVSPTVRARWLAALPGLEGTPIGPLMAEAKPGLGRALADMSIDAPLLASWSRGAGAVWLSGPLSVQSASGAALRLAATGGDEAGVARVTLPEGAFRGAGRLALSGPGLPSLTLDIGEAAWSRQGLRLEATADAVDWRGAGARLELADAALALRSDGGAGRLSIAGRARASGPVGTLAVRGFAGPLDVEVDWSDGASAVRPASGRCKRFTAEGLSAPGFEFGAFALGLCPAPGGAFFQQGAGGAGGGFDLDGATLTGRLADETRAPATLSFADARVRFSTAGEWLATHAAAAAPALAIRFAPERTFRLSAPAAGALVRSSAKGWRAIGEAADARLEDPALPVAVEAMTVRWSAAPEGDRAPVRFTGSALVSDKEAVTRFAPLDVRIGEGVLDDARIVADGVFATAARGGRLGRFSAVHQLTDGAGAADILVEALTFSSDLELAEVTPLAVGVVENVRGPVTAEARATWSGPTTAVAGVVELGGVSAATAGLGVVQDVRGRILFDDLLTLTTPPGQTLSVGSVNPGVEVRDGLVRFQLLPAQQVRVEDVRFPFSGGALSVEPTTVTIGAAESQYVLRLERVDVATFLADLKLTNLAATGRVSGVLPLTIEPLGGRIEGGLLTADPGGGVISYVGPGSDADTAGGQLAFDALKGFRYDDLTLTVDGAIDGELVSTIRFAGVNLEPVRPIPQFPQLAGRELPFRYNVTLRAPFKALVQQATETLNPLSLIGRAQVETSSGPVQTPPPTTEPQID